MRMKLIIPSLAVLFALMSASSVLAHDLKSSGIGSVPPQPSEWRLIAPEQLLQRVTSNKDKCQFRTSIVGSYYNSGVDSTEHYNIILELNTLNLKVTQYPPGHEPFEVFAYYELSARLTRETTSVLVNKLQIIPDIDGGIERQEFEAIFADHTPSLLTIRVSQSGSILARIQFDLADTSQYPGGDSYIASMDLINIEEQCP